VCCTWAKGRDFRQAAFEIISPSPEWGVPLQGFNQVSPLLLTSQAEDLCCGVCHVRWWRFRGKEVKDESRRVKGEGWRMKGEGWRMKGEG
jgi:hypothetical protein